MRKKIMFLYHVKEREYFIIKIIEEQIKKYNPQAEIRIGEFYASIIETINFNPDVIVSMPPRDCYSSNYLTIIKLLTKAVVFSMTTEGYVNFDEEFVRQHIGYNTYSNKLVDYYIMWGPKTCVKYGNNLLQTGKVTDLRRIKNTGYVLYEKNKMLKIYQKDKRYLNIYEWGKVFDRRILVLTGFVKADVDIDYFYKLGYFGDQRMVSKISKEQIDKVIEIKNNDALYREKYIDDIIDAAKKMPNYGFIIKLHPVEINSKTKYYDKLKDIKNIYIISEQIPIGGLWEIIDVMIHYNSTCNMEAYIYGVPTIFRYDSIRKDNLSTSELLIHESTYPIEINDNKGLIECLQGDISYKRIYATEKKLYELFNWKRNKEYKPSEKIAKYICKASKSQKLLLNDKEVKKAINSIEFETIYNNLITNWISKATIQNSINLIKLLCLKILCKK